MDYPKADFLTAGPEPANVVSPEAVFAAAEPISLDDFYEIIELVVKASLLIGGYDKLERFVVRLAESEASKGKV